jgi:hypothetical protein
LLFRSAFDTEISLMICLLNSFRLMLFVLPVAMFFIVDMGLWLFKVFLAYKFTWLHYMHSAFVNMVILYFSLEIMFLI